MEEKTKKMTQGSTEKKTGKHPEKPENQIIVEKKRKVRELREAGINPYANDFSLNHDDVLRAASMDVSVLPGEAEMRDDAEIFRVGGRVMSAARFGKAGFFKIRHRGAELQVYVRKDNIAEDEFIAFKKCEVGDHIGASGPLFLTNKGKCALKAVEFRLLTKAVRPLPEKFHGLKDPELRYRMRYLDMVMNPEVVEVFRIRAKLIRYVRSFLDRLDFIEVETPMMHSLVGGAAARPFITRHNALDMELFMRIAPELYLKRLLVGGLERVYELGRCFRNEGLSRRHNPEFTMLEFYMAYATYEDLMELTQKLIAGAVNEIKGSHKVLVPLGDEDSVEVDFTPPWPRISVIDATISGLRKHGFTPPAREQWRDEEALGAFIKANKLDEGEEGLAVELASADDWGKRLGALFEAFGENALPMEQPVFVVDYPAAVSPLSRKKDGDDRLVDRFEVFAAGREIGNAFSELNDPDDQRERFVKQMEQKKRGAAETMDYDEDYCRALEFGMPPAAGEGIGIDRLAMILCGCGSIRDVILFPLLRPEAGAAETGRE